MKSLKSTTPTQSSRQRADLSNFTPEQKLEHRRAQWRKFDAKPERKARKAVTNKAYYDANLTSVERREAKAEYLKTWRRDNPVKERDGKLRQNYGITLQERDALLEVQGFVCAICAAEVPGGRGDWHTDHCHSSGLVRGILCQHCNLMLGHARDNTDTLARAITYLGK
ncbi:endonuclease VII domain-containing protein [Bradyrhizobium quebecense]|uniref:Endonuclease VII domain-containing protein n=1 Tax=Bradyrhizobium quebecense TaxID=2748629 RepID=A0A974ADL9_9BRAD|nr:endonuclease VII domain-containing protein [Bradyrhizobium quebecense]UGA46797.1 endonuclease VII domain-containing protein [Bradyrhizobium quebecense]